MAWAGADAVGDVARVWERTQVRPGTREPMYPGSFPIPQQVNMALESMAPPAPSTPFPNPNFKPAPFVPPSLIQSNFAAPRQQFSNFRPGAQSPLQMQQNAQPIQLFQPGANPGYRGPKGRGTVQQANPYTSATQPLPPFRGQQPTGQRSIGGK